MIPFFLCKHNMQQIEMSVVYGHWFVAGRWPVGPFQRQSAFEVTFVSHEWSGLQHPDPKILGLAV